MKKVILFLLVLFISNLSKAADVPDDLILYGEDSVTLESEACVSGGSVVSGGDLTLGETAGIMGDAYVWETLTMADGSYITGDANVGLTATLDGTAVVEGTLSESVTDLPEVTIPTTTIPTGSTRVKVKAGEMKILRTGNYASVSVAPLGVLILRGGTYNIKELVLSKGSQIKIKGTSEIVVGVSLNWGAKKSIPDDLTRAVSELTVNIPNKTKNSISGYFKGIIYAPNGSVEVKNGGEVVGIVEAKSVTVDTGGIIRSPTGATECSDTEAGDDGVDDGGDGGAGDDVGGAGDGGDADGSDASDGLPSDPVDVASELDPTVSTTLGVATEFLYTGDDPIQTGVEEGTINVTRVAVIRGEVTERDGDVLSGVTISILDHDEYGSTLTRDDGMFDMVVNGGSYLTVVYKKDGYIPVHRKIDIPWMDYVWADDVAMVAYDSEVTTIDLSGTTTALQMAQGSESTDDDGTRTATILFPTGTSATMTLEDGTTETLTTLNIRATEYTVGEDGPNAMPATLPANSAYTYAVELSVDEAVTAEATEVTFNQPVYFYVENFLNFLTGEVVPTGYYDRELSAWVPSDSGVIIEILGDSDGDLITEIDSDGDGLADDATALSSLGMSDEERTQLTSTYTTGQTLWRVPLEHFSPWDCNWPFSAPDDAEAPTEDSDDDQDEDEDNPSCKNGSIIECQNQILGEIIPITGTPFTLNYRSDRVKGRKAKSTLDIQVTGDTIPSTLKSVLLEITVAGRLLEVELSAATNQSYQFKWDGLDAYGREVQGAQEATVRIGYIYSGVYNSTSRFATSGSGIEITGSRTRQEVGLWQTYSAQVSGALDQKEKGLGGWSLGIHNYYDVNEKVIYFGNGEKRSAQSITSIIETIAGTGEEDGYSGDEGLATSAKLSSPWGMAVDGEGNLFIAAYGSNTIRKVDSAGIITTVAGTGSVGYSGDGGLATSATLYYPTGVAIDAEGNLFIADSYNNVIRKVDTSGIITTVAGTGSSGYSGDGGLATSAIFYRPYSIAADDEGNLFITDSANNVVRKIDTEGIITTVVGTGSTGSSGDGGLATSATLYNPRGIAVDGEGNLFIANTYSGVIRKVDTEGIITRVAGIYTGTGSSGDGGLATSAPLDYPRGIAVDREGNLFIADTNEHVIRKVDAEGIITTIAGSRSDGGYGLSGYSGDGGPAVTAKLHYPYGVAVDKDGDLFIADSDNSVIRKLSQKFPDFTNLDITISSEDGTQIYKFNEYGQHQSTVDTKTGTTLYTFGYNSNNLLETITDEDGNVTTINHDSDGNPTSIVGPFGQTTTFEVDTNGYLKTVTNPVGESYVMTYDENGLLETFTNPRGYSSSFEYDDLGYLAKDTNAASNSQTLARESTDDGYQVTHTSPEGMESIYKVETDSTDQKIWTNTMPDGTESTVTFGTDGSKETTTPDGTTTKTVSGPDPRFGMEAPITESLSVTTPAGLSYEFSMEREAELADDDDLLSLVTQTDTLTVNGKTYTSVYDATTYEQTTTTPELREVISSFDSKGKLTKTQIGSSLEPTSYTYDSNGRLSTITVGTTDPRVYTLSYYTADDSSKGLLESITDSLSRTISFEYDEAGRVTSQTEPDGRIISYTYDEDGNLTSITPPGKPEHTFSYNNLDLGSAYIAPDISLSSHTTEYSYNKDKQMDLVTRPDGKTIDFEYDSSGRVSTIDADGDTYSYAYSSTTGLLTSISDPFGGSLAFTYDGDLLLTSTLTGDVTGSVGFTYNDDFWVTKETINSATSYSFDYDDDGLLTTAGSLSLTRSTDHGMTTNTTLSSVTSSIEYTEIGELESEDFSYAGSSIYSTTYTRDDLGRITDKTVINDGTTVPYTYSYDDAGRLETATYVSSTTTYAYDDNGNRLTKTKDGVTISATYDDQDRLLTYGDNTYTYADNGELLTKTHTIDGTTTYTYDILGNLKTVSLPDGTEIEYVIDAQNRRVGKKESGTLTQGFIYKNQLRPIAELDGSNNIVSTFIYASKSNIPDYMVKSGTTYRIISDHLGSPQLIVSVSDGSIVQEITYDEFGNILSDTNPGFQPFGFAGGIYDQDTKLTRFGARDYDAETGRWTTKDPIGFRGGDSNLYVYCINNPVNFLDPNGLSFWGSFGKGVLYGLAGAALIATGGAVAIGLGVPAWIITSGLGAAGLVGGIATVAKYTAKIRAGRCISPDEIGYDLGALSGGAMIGVGTGRFFSNQLSPPGNAPAPGWAGWNPLRDARQVWKFNLKDPIGTQLYNAMETGPNPLSAAGSVATGGLGLAEGAE